MPKKKMEIVPTRTELAEKLGELEKKLLPIVKTPEQQALQYLQLVNVPIV